MRIKLSHSEIYLRDDGIVQVNTTDHSYTVDDIKAMNTAQGEVCGSIKMPLLVVAHPDTSIESDVREYMATPESTRFSLAEAFVIKSVAQKILANFYLRVNKPAVPTQIFTNINEAVKWLGNYLPSDL